MFEVELTFLRLLENLRTDNLNRFFEFVTMLGEDTLMIIIVVTLWFAFDKRLAQKIAFITVASLSVNGIIKNFAKIPRPFADGQITCVRPDTATGYSFPSGHTHNFATWITVIAIRLKKIWFVILAGILIIAVGFSRMFLGAHYPSDVLVGGVLGVVFAVVGSKIYDKIENKRKLYIATIVVLTPFAVLFMFGADRLFENFYKFYGMLAGLYLGVMFEEKYAPLRYDVPWWKKLVRIAVALAAAYTIKEVVKSLAVSNIVQLSFMIDIIGYMTLAFVVLGLCPLMFKRFKI